jgi:small subunit ribosomal protein S6
MRTPSLKNYEATFILGEDATETTAKEKLATLTETIKGFGGNVSKSELWGKRELAYPIKRNLIGFYTTLWFELPTDQVNPLEKLLRFDESILRSLVTMAYTTAQPGSLYPVKEEDEKPARGAKRGSATPEVTEPASAEAELRRTSSAKPAKKAAKTETPEEDTQNEEERMQKLDAALGDILKDEA